MSIKKRLVAVLLLTLLLTLACRIIDTPTPMPELEVLPTTTPAPPLQSITATPKITATLEPVPSVTPGITVTLEPVGLCR